MLVAATGLHGDTMRPLYLHARYTTFGPYGKKKSEGTLEYVWLNKSTWRATYTEQRLGWTQWSTDKGRYRTAGETYEPPYPDRLLPGALLDPLHLSGAPRQAPDFFAKEEIGAATVSCFRNSAVVQLNAAAVSEGQDDPSRFCTVGGRPLLELAQGDYTLIQSRFASFAGRIVALHSTVLDLPDHILDVDVDTLRSPSPAEVSSCEPNADALPVESAASTEQTVRNPHRVHWVAPIYPAAMKEKRVQGTVRIEGTIGVDGKVTITSLLHSPDPALTDSVRQAVGQWRYTPAIKNGLPFVTHTQINVKFVLGR